MPLDHGLLPLESDRKPDITSVYSVLRSPTISHINKAIRMAGYRQYVRALRIKRHLRVLSPKRIFQFLPRSPNRGSDRRSSRIRSPARTAGHNQIIFPLLFEQGWSFHETPREETGVLTGITRIIIGQLRYMQGTILFRGLNMISDAIVIHEKVHIPSHLSGDLVTPQ